MIKRLQAISLALSLILVSILSGVWYFSQQTVEPNELYSSYEQVFLEKEMALSELNRSIFTSIMDKSETYDSYKTIENYALAMTESTETMVFKLKHFVNRIDSLDDVNFEGWRKELAMYQNRQLNYINDFRVRKKLEQQVQLSNLNLDDWWATVSKENMGAAAMTLAYQVRLTENIILNHFHQQIGQTIHEPTLCSWEEPVVSVTKNEVKRGETFKADIVLGAWCRIPKQHTVRVNDITIKPENGHYYFTQNPDQVGTYKVNVQISSNDVEGETPKVYEKSFEYEVVK